MAKLSDGRCRRGFVLIPPQELSLRRQKSIHDKGHHPHAEAAWGASRERLLPGTGKQGSRLETPTQQRRNCTIGCGARRDNPAPFPELFLGRDTEVIAIDCKNLGWNRFPLGRRDQARRFPCSTAPFRPHCSREGRGSLASRLTPLLNLAWPRTRLRYR